MKIPTTHAAEGVIRLLETLPAVDVDKKITPDFAISTIESINAYNARELISTLVCLGFINNELPTRRWKDYIDGKRDKATLRRAIREAYPVFEQYPDAHQQPKQTIINWVRSNYHFSERTAERAERVFRHLCQFAEFQNDDKPHAPQPATQNLQQTTGYVNISLPLSFILNDELVSALQNYARKM